MKRGGFWKEAELAHERSVSTEKHLPVLFSVPIFLICPSNEFSISAVILFLSHLLLKPFPTWVLFCHDLCLEGKPWYWRHPFRMSWFQINRQTQTTLQGLQLTSNIWHLTSDIWNLTYYIWHLTSEICHLRSDILYKPYGICLTDWLVVLTTY